MVRSIGKKRCCSVGECPSCKISFPHEEHQCRRQGDSSGYTDMNSNEAGQMECLRHRKVKSFKIINHHYRVPSSTSVPFYLQRRSKKSHYPQSQRNKISHLRLRGSRLSSCLSRASCSSGQSSPQSSFASLIFSAPSNSSQSSPSSQNSITDLPASSPLLLARPQPRIRVASLLVDPFSSARCVVSRSMKFAAHPDGF
ncbi:hypothetical protein BYT27DRAFT_6798138 [Phlegmacium glaucopus]|nr:hypothetical protein BYT27DRAFT_6798138 [Phlegmacium glaucopus]